MNKVYRFINLWLLLCILHPLLGQECELIKSAVSYKAKSLEYYQICKLNHDYYLNKKIVESIKDRLLESGQIEEFIVDTILTKLQLNKKQNKKKEIKCSDKQLSYISVRNVERGLKKNYESEDKEAFVKDLGKYTYFYLTAPILFEDFAIIQRTRTITYNNADTRILLFKKKGSAWEYVITLYSVAN